MKTLHLITRELETWEQEIVSALPAERLSISEENADYAALMEAIFAADTVMVW